MALSLAEFESKVKPRPRSVMDPFRSDLEHLRGKGYTLEQMQRYLSENSVTVSVAAISMFLNGRRAAPKRARR